jgi:hypothetical protein
MSLFSHFAMHGVDGMLRDADSQAPLWETVPNLRSLETNPIETLKEGVICIGPRKPYGTIMLFTGLFTTIGYCLVIAILVAQMRTAEAPSHLTLILAIAFALLVIPCFIFGLVGKLLTGGRITLGLSGVELAYRGITVFCPWRLFQVRAAVTGRRRAAVDFIVDPQIACQVIAFRGKACQVAQGPEVHTRQLEFVSGYEIVVRNLYEADIRECVDLLFYLGARLGTRQT